MRHPRILTSFCLGALALLVAPLRSDGGPNCDNVTTSMAASINNPVAGDESFFTLPNGPSNVMFLIDYSSSMKALPQCGDGWTAWNGATACSWPTWPTFTAASADLEVKGDGTCSFSSTASPALSWMSGYKPTATLADPGHGQKTIVDGSQTMTLTDKPSWGTGCTGDNCLFDSTKVYGYAKWTETSATPSSDPCLVKTYTWTDAYCSGTKSVARTWNAYDPTCQACLTAANASGFYFRRKWTTSHIEHTTSISRTGKCTESATTVLDNNGNGSQNVWFSGGWLNANPPKFISARKVIKDVAWIDPAGTTWRTDQLRLGVSVFPYSQTSRAAIAVPVGPSQADSYPVKLSAYVTARQAILDAMNGNYPSGVTVPVLVSSTPTATSLFHLGQYFATAGKYDDWFGTGYTNTDYAPTTKGLMKAGWVDGTTTPICWPCQKSAIIIVTDGSPNSEMTFPSPSDANYNIGTYANSDYTLGKNCGAGTTCSGTTASACCSPSDTSAPSKLPRVASWLNHTDLSTAFTDPQTVQVSTVGINIVEANAQQILQATANMGGGTFKNAPDGTALAAAVATAIQQVSTSSTSFSAPSATALTTINAVDTKAFLTRFKPSSAGKATWEGHLFEWMLFDEAAAGCDPTKKFDPSDETQKIECGKNKRLVYRNFNKDFDKNGYNVCSGTFVVDQDCYEVEEKSDTGKWYRKIVDAGAEASYYWDAGNVLSTPSVTGYRTAAEPTATGNIAQATNYTPLKTPRNLWTALPDGTMVELVTKNAGQLFPYLNIDKTWCTNMESAARLCSGTGCPVTTGTDWQTSCAQQVILFLRGWDVMDQDGDQCAGPGNPSNKSGSGSNGTTVIGTDPITGAETYTAGSTNCTNSGGGTGEERDRLNDAGLATGKASFYKLGDIFHSSPVLVHPPSSEGLCRLGTENQCVRTLFGYTGTTQYQTGYQTVLDQLDGSTLTSSYSGFVAPSGKVDAYRAWRNDHATRLNVVLVGSNDGFLHAFSAGNADTTTGKPDVDGVMPNVESGTGADTGEEVWAFAPIDILPKIKDSMMNVSHVYTVDGNIMVRDVWVDGAKADSNPGNTQSAAGNAADGKKQKNEFRTVIVFGERAGGTQYTALDITNAFVTGGSNAPRPTWLWSFPKPRSDDAQYMGQSWSDFSPKPPPIGPVRLAPTSTDHATGAWIPPGASTAQPFVEKWIVMINGGYDPTLTRGRAMWMLDVFTGDVIWRFTDSDFKANLVPTRGNTAGMFPVPAAAALVDLGDPSQGLDSDNFFDLATWGDMGGNLFVARFWNPGVRSSNGTGPVTNWRVARAFEQGRQSDDSQWATNRTEFFYMASNAYEPTHHQLRTLIGSGNREQILQQGKACGPDDVFSCCRDGCSTSTSSTLDYGVCKSTGAFSCTADGQMTTTVLDDTCPATGASACTSSATSSFSAGSSYKLTCPQGGKSPTGSATCSADGVCSVSEVGSAQTIPFNGAADKCDLKARYYGIWTYGGVAAKTLSTDPSLADWTNAQTFDQNRFTDVASYAQTDVCQFTPLKTCSLVDTTQAHVSASGALTCLSGAGTVCSATANDPGWFYTYNVTCPTSASCETSCTNERTASAGAVVNSCATWNGFIPQGAATAGSGSDFCSGAKTTMQKAISYASNFVSGIPDTVCNQGSDADQVYRGAKRGTIAPPSGPMVRMGISAGGRVYYSTLQLDPGASAANTALGSRDVASPLYWIELSRDAHLCRHGGTGCE